MILYLHYHNRWTHCATEWWQYRPLNSARAAIWTLIKIKAVSPLAASAAFFGSCYATGFLNRVLEFSIKNERKALSPLAVSAAFLSEC